LIEVSDMQKISTTTLVVAAALIGADGRVLLQKRRADRQHGGLWEFPGGKIEPGESPESAAIREISEELGLTLAQSALCPLGFASGAADSGSPPGTVVILLYTCRAWAGQPECRDADALEWYEPAALAGLPMPPLDIPLAATLVASLARAR
jgi:8-oxo-dGTP diphosphatase